MTPETFLAWRKRLGFTKVKAAAMLGISRNTIKRYETGATVVPLHVALAMAALAMGLPPVT